MKGEGTIPSPIRMPSTLPVNDSIRAKPGSFAPCRKVMSSDHSWSRIRASTPRSTSS